MKEKQLMGQGRIWSREITMDVITKLKEETLVGG